MLIPTSFKLAGSTWKVIQRRSLKGDLGRCERDKATILLLQSQEPTSKEVAFLHELVHAIKFTMGDDGPHDEKYVDGFAQLLHQFFITQQGEHNATKEIKG